jgi:quercetin dioxygenase-like cupin family protein
VTFSPEWGYGPQQASKAGEKSMRSILIVPAALAAACGPAGMAAGETPAASLKSVSNPIVRTAHTLSGQPLRLPQGDSEMVAAAVEIPSGGSTTIHQHRWSRFVYVERGPLRIVNEDTRETHELQTGQAFAEVIAQWHQGFAPGAKGARVIVIDLVPPGETNMMMR